MRSRPPFGRIAATTLETLAWVGLATALVAILDSVATPAGLGSIYLIAVLAVAIRRGQVAALAAAVLGVLILNYFFIQPLHQLTIADSDNVVALGVLLLAALVVGRLAAQSRRQARRGRAARRAGRGARARGGDARRRRHRAARRHGRHGRRRSRTSLDRAGRGELRLGASAAPRAEDGETVLRLPDRGPLRLALRGRSSDGRRRISNRIATPLARLLDVAAERERAAAAGAEAEAARAGGRGQDRDPPRRLARPPLAADRDPHRGGGPAGGGTTAEDRIALIDAIEEEADRLTRLIGNLLDLSRIEAGAVHPRTDWCDLLDVISTAVSHVRERHAPGRIQIELDGELPLVRADASQLERVFANLIENALRFSPRRQPVADQRRRRGGQGHRPRHRPRPGRAGLAARARSSSRSSAAARRRRGRPGSVSRSARASSRPTAASCACRPTAADGTAFAVSFPLVEQPATVG